MWLSVMRECEANGHKQWLQTQNLIPLLLSNLSPDREAATQTSAGDFLKAIITISANATAQDTNVIGPNELTRQLVSEECVQTLITDMLRGGNTLTVGVGIIIEVIRKNNSDYDLDNQIGPVPKSSDPIYLGTLLRCFAKNVTNFMDLINNASQKKELKVAFGEKIEPLGFDRFKTCELMAELLHCSNMALLNERGSEAEVRRRDAERERLKVEGKLSLAKDSSEANNEDGFGTSVDSSGFHHARAPSLSSDSPEEIKRPLEVSNGAEDEFENVTASEAIVDEMKDSFDDKEHFVGEPLERSPKDRPRSLDKNLDADLFVPPLSPKKPQAHSRSKSDGKSKVEASEAKDADSPTSAGLTDRLNNVELEKDTVMEDSPAKEEDTGDKPLALSPYMDDKPAPLFYGKRSESPEKLDLRCAEGSASTDDQTPAASVETNHTGEGQTASLNHTSEDDDVAPYELDVDGQPVVGDLLKMKFVEHHVVPTILVSGICAH
jgi:SIT4-associating protein SAP185/190